MCGVEAGAASVGPTETLGRRSCLHKRWMGIGTLSLAVLLAGCAATVKKQDGGAPVPVGTKAPGKHVVLNLTGSDVTMSAKDWTGFKGIWNDECSDEFHEAEAQFSMQDGAPQPTGSEGALVVVNVVDYRYVSIGARVMFGIMTGNAFINAQVGFRDLKTGDTWASERSLTTRLLSSGRCAASTLRRAGTYLPGVGNRHGQHQLRLVAHPAVPWWCTRCG